MGKSVVQRSSVKSISITTLRGLSSVLADQSKVVGLIDVRRNHLLTMDQHTYQRKGQLTKEVLKGNLHPKELICFSVEMDYEILSLFIILDALIILLLTLKM